MIVVTLSFVADLSLFNRDDDVHSLYRDPIICCRRENILFAASPMVCSTAEGGNLTIITVLISHLCTRKHLDKILWILLLSSVVMLKQILVHLIVQVAGVV